MRDETLSCYHCGNSGYADFAELALHMEAFHGHVIKSEERKMAGLPAPRGQRSGSERALPPPEGGAMTPFLKAEHIGKPGRRARLQLIGVRDAVNSQYSDLFADVQLGRQQFTWGLKFNNSNYRLLYERFGTKRSAWKGIVNVQVKKASNGAAFIAII